MHYIIVEAYSKKELEELVNKKIKYEAYEPLGSPVICENEDETWYSFYGYQAMIKY